MKRCLMILMIMLIIFADSMHVFAVRNKMNNYIVANKMQLLKGDWFDDDGVRVLTIDDRYINGCEVLSAYDFAGSSNFARGVFRLRERNGTRDMNIHWRILNEPNDYLVIDFNQMLHRTHNYFYESIADIHLGMSTKNVRCVLGEPQSIISESAPIIINGVKYTDGWFYQSKGMIIKFEGNGVTSIVVMRNSPLRLAKSGLSIHSPFSEFIKEYNIKTPPGWEYPFKYADVPHSIGHGEYISFSKNRDTMTLTMYFN